MQDPTRDMMDPEHYSQLAALGTEMGRILESEAFQSGILLVRAQIYEEWCQAASPQELANLKGEQQALERLLKAFEDIHINGIIAQEAVRRANADLEIEEFDTGDADVALV